MRGVSIVVGLVGAAIVCAAGACVGDVPGAPDGGDGGSGGDGGAEAGTLPLLTCSFQNVPGKLDVLSMPPGVTVDRERTAFVNVIDSIHAAIVAFSFDFQNNATQVWTSVITLNQSSPNPKTFAMKTIANTTRPLWVGRINDGVGILTFDAPNQGPRSLSLWKITDADFASNDFTIGLHLSADLSTEPMADDASNATVQPLDQNDSFVVAEVKNKGNQNFRRVVASRLRTANTVTQFHDLGLSPVTSAHVRVGNELHVFMAGANGMVVQPKQAVFALDTANVVGAPRLLPQHLGLPSVSVSPSTVALAFAEGDFSTGLDIKGLRVGSAPSSSIGQIDPKTLPGITFGPGEAAFAQAAHAGWHTFDNQPPLYLMLVGPGSPGKGAQVFWFDADGTPRARTTTTSTILANEPMVAIHGLPTRPTTAANAEFAVMWINRIDAVDGGQTDTIRYGKIVCN